MRPHPLISKLGLGTAQFGLDSGAPTRGRAPEAEVREILGIAGKAGVSVLDTGAASVHGESILGQVMPRPAPFKITVKAARGDKGPDFVEQEARAALARLGLVRADAIMVQAAGDLFAPYGKAMWQRLLDLREAGLFERVGISAYASDDPAGLARRFGPDLIQAPASLLDQRLLVDGSLAAVRDMGVEVHLRSIFLNGLLFLPPDRAPSHLGAAAISRLSRARRLIAEGRSDPLQAALAFALSRPEATAVIVGAATAAEVTAVIAAAASPPPDLDWDDMAMDDPQVLESQRWAAA
ncbi:MAG TPA: aldo/keto reductase [Caulobacteraceae bacterium]|nr:aldo/keto reductase [Caulobacteraceae bacterium]